MNKIIILTATVIMSSCMNFALANDVVKDASLKALEFNKWYIHQSANLKFPVLDNKDINKYVSKDTLKKLVNAYKSDDLYDGDYFIKSQGWDRSDWDENISVVQTYYDPVCMNVYVAFGKEKKHIVVDCFVKDGGTLKIKSVTQSEITQ